MPTKRTEARDARRQARLAASGWATIPRVPLLDRESALMQNPVYAALMVYGVPWNVRRTVSDDGGDRTVAHCG